MPNKTGGKEKDSGRDNVSVKEEIHLQKLKQKDEGLWLNCCFHWSNPRNSPSAITIVFQHCIAFSPAKDTLFFTFHVKINKVIFDVALHCQLPWAGNLVFGNYAVENIWKIGEKKTTLPKKVNGKHLLECDEDAEIGSQKLKEPWCFENSE